MNQDDRRKEVNVWTYNHRMDVLLYARRLGGSFLYSLGELFMVADHANSIKLLAAFPMEFDLIYSMKLEADKRKESQNVVKS